MTNLRLYERTSQLKDYLENSEFEEFTKAQIEQANDKLSEVFAILDRRRETMRKRFGR